MVLKFFFPYVLCLFLQFCLASFDSSVFLFAHFMQSDYYHHYTKQIFECIFYFISYLLYLIEKHCSPLMRFNTTWMNFFKSCSTQLPFSVVRGDKDSWANVRIWLCTATSLTRICKFRQFSFCCQTHLVSGSAANEPVTHTQTCCLSPWTPNESVMAYCS